MSTADAVVWFDFTGKFGTEEEFVKEEAADIEVGFVCAEGNTGEETLRIVAETSLLFATDFGPTPTADETTVGAEETLLDVEPGTVLTTDVAGVVEGGETVVCTEHCVSVAACALKARFSSAKRYFNKFVIFCKCTAT